MTFQTTERYLKAIGEKNRLKIIAFLMIDTFCVCELVELLDISQPSISQHLRRLKELDIITEERRGKWVFYAINQEQELYSFLSQLVSTFPSMKEKINGLYSDGNRILCE